MGSLDRRIQQLEELYGLEDPQERARTEERRAEIRAKLQRIAAILADPEAELPPRKRSALEDLMETVRRRRAGRV